MRYQVINAELPRGAGLHRDGSAFTEKMFTVDRYKMVDGRCEWDNVLALSHTGDKYYITGLVAAPVAIRFYGDGGEEEIALRAALKKARRVIEDKIRKDQGFLFSLI